ncbi:hypothetical protein ACF0H5_013822 [Mactra antiquata]
METRAAGTDNLLLVTDSFKVTHYLQYPPNTTLVYSYFESRGGKFPSTVFFGLQYIIKRWLCGRVVTKEKIQDAKEFYRQHFGRDYFNEEGWTYIAEHHDGHLPLRIKAVPEGTVVPYKNVLFTVENTDPKCFWLTNYLETLLVQAWYPMSVATNSRYYKKIIAKYLDKTADNLDQLPFMLHDYGFRGSGSVEATGIGGCSHLINFIGTDTTVGAITARQYYGYKKAGLSVGMPGAEHSTITTWGRNGEVEAFRNMLTKFPDGPISCVSDSYNIWETCEKVWGDALKDLVLSRGDNGAVAIRPDSGDPPEIVVKVLNILGKCFGTTANKKGYKLLPPYIRVAQGDGVSYESLQAILENAEKNGWSADNLFFGSGGALLQRLERDTQKCAYKCSYAVCDGKEINAFKEPITDLGKKSKKGRLSLEYDPATGKYETKEQGTGDIKKDILVTVFENGKLLRDYSFDEVRKCAEIELVLNAEKLRQYKE